MFVIFLCSCRSGLHCSKSRILNSAPVFAQLLVQRSVLLVNTIKTSAPPSPPISSSDNERPEKPPRTRQKTVKVSSGISEHDLNVKISHICEWLGKGYHVSIFISKNANKPEVRFVKIVSVILSLNFNVILVALF